MEKNELKVEFCSFEEIAELINRNERLVFIDDGICETVGKYKDIPDIIVDLNRKFGSMDLNIYDFDGGITKPLLSTMGYFLNKCIPEVRNDIIDRLVDLQNNTEEVKEYKLIDEQDLENYYDFCKGVDDDERYE